MSDRNMSKSITRMLQHSILQLCNEHIGYTHKLQILGVLCMTVDDEQQELVVKVNNTLKRVNPINSKEGPGPQVTQAPPGIQHITKDVNDMTRSASPSQLVVGGRRSHGRKGTNPVKVHQVYEEAIDNSEGEEEDDEPITVIPTAPEASLSPVGASSLSQSPVSLPFNPKQRMLALSDIKASGSHRRKTSQQFRVPPYSSSPSSPYTSSVRSLLQESAESPYAVDLSRNEDGCSEESSYANAGTSSNVSTSQSQISGQHGLSLPIYVAGTYSNDSGDTSQENDSSERASSERSHLADRVNSDSITQIDGADLREEDGPNEQPKQSGEDEAAEEADSPIRGRLYVEMDETGMRIKEEPREENRDFDKYDYASQLDNNSDDYPQNLSRSYRNENSRMSGTPDRNDSLASQVAYSGLNLLTGSIVTAGSSGGAPANEGLSITYTSMGPFTVGANGRDVSNSSRIKDIIMYDDQSPLSQQKGARIETDYIVDKLGMDGRKRRRRAPEDQLTPEEIAEYLGQGADKITFTFKCKYCSDEFDNVTRYIQHTLAAHQAYICHQCGKSFTTKSSLLRHRPIHTGMRRFACSICKKTFYRKDKCKAHIKRHLGTDPNVDKYTQAENVHIEVE